MRAIHIYAIALAVAAVDQSAKLVVVSRVPYGGSVPLFGSVEVTLVRNPGGAFGLFQSGAIPLTIISLVVVAGIVIISRRGVPLSPLIGISLALQLGGALGNLIDRLRYGHVVDFINLQVWPIFNFADMAITIGILLLASYLVLCGRTAPDQVGDAPLADSEPAKR